MSDGRGPELPPWAAVVATLVFVLVMPLPIAIVVPWRLAGAPLRESLGDWTVSRAVGAALLLAGVAVVAHCMARFVRQGRGTPAPVLPTQHLVVTGLYRYVRNPMYLGVLVVIAGQGLVYASPAVVGYALAMAVAFHLFVLLYEEPALHRRFGAEYEAYCGGVRRWLPRRRPWRAD